MRIISGEFRGRKIKAPDSKFIRPTADRVRETLFNILNNRISFNGINVLDIYAGSGSVGFECLSRGASEIHFVENNFRIQKNLIQNISSLEVDDKCVLYKMEAVKFSSIKRELKYDFIFADPPYQKDDIYIVLENLTANKYLAPEGLMIIERSIKTRENDMNTFGKEPFKIIGDTCLYEFYF